MSYRLAADAVLLLHLAFVLAVAIGGLAVVWRPRLAWLHLPIVAWAAWIEFSGRICPLTPLENHFRRLAGESGYEGGFIEHYIVPVLYPGALTRGMQIGLGALVLAINIGFYLWAWRRACRLGR